MKGNYSKTIVYNFNDDLKWHTDDSNNSIQCQCGSDLGELVSASAVISAMPAFNTFSSKGELITSWYEEAAKLSLGITDDDIE